jgi:hypothetical protein
MFAISNFGAGCWDETSADAPPEFGAWQQAMIALNNRKMVARKNRLCIKLPPFNLAGWPL